MCGIVGAVWSPSAEPITAQTLRRMTDSLRHRGPDDTGHYLSADGQGGVGLGHRRLSVIDLSTGRQPISNEDGTVWVVFNGEIYNFRELRHDLEKLGHQFRTATDTEVLVHLFEQYGADSVNHLRGMFAFAIWDARTRTAFLARDRMGQKPLVYRLDSGRLLFASQPRAILQAPDVPRQLNPAALKAYLRFQCVPHPMSIYDGISKLPPAHVALYRDGRLTLRRYWSPSAEVDERRTERDWIDELQFTIEEATRMQMVSDVPLGAFLSGGIDSTIITGLMQRFASQPIKTFSIGFPSRACDESSFALSAARHLGTDHLEFNFTGNRLDEVIKVLDEFDEPFGDSSALPTYVVSRLARKDVTVALTGDGGDELFGGYTVYGRLFKLAWFDAMTSSAGAKTARLLRRLCGNVTSSPHGEPRFAKAVRLLAANSDERLYLLAHGAFNGAVLQSLLSPLVGDDDCSRELRELIRAAHETCRGSNPLSTAMAVHQLTYLPDDVLVKVDIASMASGLECRSPFLDHHVVELANRIPSQLKVGPQSTKRILRRAFESLLPIDIQRRSKQGFSIPVDDWCRSIWRDDLTAMLCDPRGLCSTYLDKSAVERLLSEHVSGKKNHGNGLWTLWCLEIWYRKNFAANNGRDSSSHALGPIAQETFRATAPSGVKSY